MSFYWVIVLYCIDKNIFCLNYGSSDNNLDKYSFINTNKNSAITSHVSNSQSVSTFRPRVLNKPNANLSIFELTLNYENSTTNSKIKFL